MGSETFVEVILAIFLPPVGVFLRYGCGVITLLIKNTKVFLTFMLCVIYAFSLISLTLVLNC